MEVICESEGEVSIARISGSIEKEASEDLRDVEIFKTRDRATVIDLGDVDFLDSSGLGVVVGIIREFNQSGSRLALAAPSPIVRKTLEITNINRIVPIEDSVAEAIAILQA